VFSFLFKDLVKLEEVAAIYLFSMNKNANLGIRGQVSSNPIKLKHELF
jgi:hypothetical protein